MERLTAKYGDKVVLPVIPMEIKNHADLERFHTVRKKYEENTIKLAEYEDIGLSPEEVKQFKDADEQGLLLRLPCKVGDTVYHFCKEFGQILKYDVDFINIADGVITISCSSYSQGIDDTGECLDEIEADITDFDFNTSTPYSFVSRTKSEVEQKLKEMDVK